MEVTVDVAVVGAGPAGSALAALLARRGISVALVDRDSFPRDKLCGEFLSYDALPIVEALGVDLAGAPSIERCVIVARHRTYDFSFPHAARGVSRLLLDDALRRRAIDLGAAPITATATAVSRDGVELDGGSRIHARIVAGAWGRWGRFDQQLARAFVRDRTHRHFGFKRHYRARQAADGEREIRLYSFRSGYLGVNEVEGGITNICGLVHARRLRGHRGRWDAFVDTIRGEERPLDTMYAAYEPAQEAFLSSEPVIFRARSAVEEGIFMIGDASGVIDPLTGNGMAMALQSAALAAPFIADALTGGRERAENAYRSRHAAMFAPRIAWSRRAAFILSRPSLLDFTLRFRPRGAAELFLRKTRADRDAIARLV